MASSPNSVTMDPVLDRLAQILEICQSAGSASPCVAKNRAAAFLPSDVQKAICALIGVQAGMTASLSEASKLFDFDSCFVDIRSSAAGLAFEGEVGDAVRVLEHVHTADLLSIHVLAAVAQAYRNLVVRNKSFMDSADSFDVIMSSLKNALSAAESKAEQYKRDNNNLLGEYTALGTLHQQVKTDSIGVESRLNMRIGDLMQDLITLRTENEGLRVAKEQLTQDAADLCALLESRDGEVLSVDQLRSASEKDQIELIQLRRKVSELSDELNQLSSKHATECSSLATLKEDAELTAHKTVFELAETSSELHRMKLELKRMREEMISVQEEKDEALSDYATLAASSQKDRAAAADSEHALRAQIAELHEQIKRLRTSELESDLRTITEELQQVKADLVLRTTQLAATASDRAKLEKELADCQSDLAESVDRVSVLKKTLQAESSYAETHEKGEQNQIAELSRRLKETEDKEAAVSRESQQSISELTKTCQALQARLKELSAGSNSLALREAFSSLDQTATLPEVAAWLTTQIQEHPDVIDAAGTGGERGALRTKILEIHTTTENSVKSLRSEIKRLSSSQVVMEKSLVEARELQQEYSDLCEVLKSEKLKLQKKIDTHNDIDAYGSMQSDMISSPVRNFPSGDEDNNLSFSEPIVFVEIGNYECRVGLWDNVHSCFSKRFNCPAIVACPRNASMLPEDLVRGASHQSGPMYQSFRETGFFFGNDAKFCAFEHPDAALRGSLDVRSVVAGDGTILDAAAYTALFKHCVAKIFDGSGEVSEISHFQAVFPFKPAFGDIEKMILGALFFEGNFPLCDSDSALCSKVYVTPESFMTAQSVGAMSAVVIDVGARVTHIVPVYEGVAIKMSMRAVRIGGEHCTDALEKLVDAKGLAAYSSSLPRRRKQIARDLKEKYGFVAESFDKAVELYGAITVEAVRVMHGSSTELPAALNRLLAVDNSDIKKDQSTISIFEEIKHPNGTAEVISLDRERFYCTEVLFGEATEPCEVPGDLDVEDSIMSAILAAAESIEDYDMRVEICEKIVLTGGSAMLPGFLERFQTSELLKEGLRKSGITSFHILIAASDKKLASSSVLNGAQTRLVALQSKTERMEGGCVSASDYEKFGSSCFDNLA